VVTALSGVLVVLAVCRVVVGVALAPRITYVGGTPPYNPVFGNNLGQQITCTFDIVLCSLAIFVLLAALLVSQFDQLVAARTRRANGPEASRPTAAATVAPAASTPSLVAGSPPRIFRAKPDVVAPKIFRGSTDATEVWAIPPVSAEGTVPASTPRIVRSARSADELGAGTAEAKRFNAPPDWPVPSGDWTPGADWTPDPSWPPAPPGWQFWVELNRSELPASNTPAPPTTPLIPPSQRFAAGTTYTGTGPQPRS
jgi:hypothetical protein